MRNNSSKFLISIIVSLLILNLGGIVFASDKVDLEATASSWYASSPYYAASRAVDGNTRTYWIGQINTPPWWITLDVGNVTNLDKLRFGWYYSYYATDFDIQVSKDGQAWENVHTGLVGAYNRVFGSCETYDLSKEARYVRIYINSVTSRFPIIPEIEVSAFQYNPRKMRFQGRLKDSSELSAEGDFKLTFRIYDLETGGAPLWSEIQEDVTIEDGALDVVLGSVEKINLSFDKQYYLGIEVDEDGEMSPRLMMTSVPYAFSSER